MKKAHERLAVYVLGVVLIAVILSIAVAIPSPTRFQYEVFKVVLALACAGVAAFIPGFLEVKVSNYVRAGGAIAVFVIIYFFSPAGLLVDAPPISTVVLQPNEYPPDSIIEVIPTQSQLAAAPLVAPDDVVFSFRNDTDDDLKLFVYDFSQKNNVESGPFQRQVFWDARPFPPDNEYRTQDKFHKSTGWFAFAVGRYSPDGDSVTVHYLTTHNVFYAASPSLTVHATEDSRQPYRAEFGVRG